jgi:hypothetical protein
VDASHGTHSDFKGHTGATMTMGNGSTYSSSTKQKINTKSSTESELVAVDDVIGQVLWTNNFLKEQGYTTKDTVIYQDNKSAILLEKNGRYSSSKKTRHIDARYFFIQDQYAQKKVSIQYCPTNNMIADFFTKPLQGSRFRKFRSLIMNL